MLSVLEREWRTLSRKMRLTEGFVLIVFFSVDDRITMALKDRLRESLIARTASLVEIIPDSPDDLAGEVLRKIFDNEELAAHRGAISPFWIEVQSAQGHPRWNDARRELLMRLNERRGRLEAELRCPLILVLPADFQRETAALAPDLWHVRSYSATLGEDSGSESLAGTRRQDSDQTRAGSSSALPGTQPAVTTDSAIPPAVRYWHERSAYAESLLGRALSFLRPGQTRPELSVWDGVAAVDAALGMNDIETAEKIARQMLAVARGSGRQQQTDTPQGQRDLSVSLNKVGDVAQAQGRLDAAARAYEESLQLRRRLLKDFGQTPQAVLDLLISLERCADLPDSAPASRLAQYQEALGLAKRLEMALKDDSRLASAQQNVTRLQEKLVRQ